MFDPTVFENLKVGIENVVYDLDNLDELVLITGREDLLDMAVMSRSFSLTFELRGLKEAAAEIRLDAGLQELAAEILETPGKQPGCELKVRFYKNVKRIEDECAAISRIVAAIWEPEIPPVQTVTYIVGEEANGYRSMTEVRFSRTINEEQMEDIPNLADHMLQTLEQLNRI
ncbi:MULTISPECIES: hypothetical protein [Paenibacillus]|uniref:Uncharacterized protein n=1 Tax=Paenibacillus lactis 154 TaxID=743719 RepID=G4H7T4_9BACL|nr:hypothetical protein [Paenibacillus lactis]EHB67919.1 hypothetical protein PaelaDRAFT_0045 [Paenibacillus lactis 154]